MKNLKLTCTIFLALSFSYAEARPSASQLDACQKQGAAYGNGKGPSTISGDCFNYFKEVTSPDSIKQSADGSWRVVGHRNIVFVNQHQNEGLRQQGLIAGNQTQITAVIAVAVDAVNKEVAVLDKSGDILFFSMVLTGNMVPLRILKSDELKGAVSLEINPKTNEVIITNPASGLILYFSRLADINGREGERNLSLLNSNPI